MTTVAVSKSTATTCHSKKVLAIDIETYSDVNLKDCGVYRYAEDPSFTILLLSASYDNEPVKTYQLAAGDALPDSLLSDLTDPQVIKEAHNAQFERVCLSVYLGYPAGTYLDPAQWFCTMAHANTLSLPGSLAKAGEALGLSEDEQKLSTGKALIRYFSTPSKTEGRQKNEPWHDWKRWELYTEYNAQDVVTELAIEQKMAPYPIHTFEKLIYAMDQRINDRGIQLDLDFVRAVSKWNEEHNAHIKELARELTGLDNPNSPAQLLDWFDQQGVPIESTRKEVLADWIGKTGNSDVEQMIRYKLAMGKTSLKKYDKILEAVCSDGRIRGTLMYYGGNRTGRWAGRLLQVQNLPQTHLDDIELCRDLIKDGDFEALELVHDDLPDTMKQLIRTAIIAPPGKKLVVCDYSAIEARLIAWLAQEEWRQQAFAEGKDIYCESASKMFGVPVVKHGENGHLRQKGKIAELALGYGGSPNALKTMGGEKMGLTEPEMKDIVNRWRKASPKIVKLWKSAERCTELAAGGRLQAQLHPHNIRFFGRDGNLCIQLPSGRCLCYNGLHPITTRRGREFEYNGVDQQRKTWGPISTYGGKLVENITQAIARDCLATAMLRLEKAGYNIVFHVHDEVIIECDADTAEDDYKEIQRIMSLPLKWAPGLILTAEGFISDFYKKD